MKKTYNLITFAVVFSLFLFGCKSKTEKLGDQHLEAGRIQNAIAMYTKAEQKGKVSDEFYDNFSTAYLKMAERLAENDPGNTVVRGYLDQSDKFLKESKNEEVVEYFIKVLTKIGVLQTQVDFDYEFTLQGFNNIKLAEEYSAKHNKLGAAIIKAARDEAESKVVKAAIEKASAVDNSVAQEYELALAEVVAPNNEELLAAINPVRKKNRGDFLIYQAVGIEQPSRWVDKYGYVMAFPSITVGPTELKGEIQFWNSSGNNTELVVADIRLVSTDGKEVNAKQVGVGWCTGTDAEAKTKERLAGKGRLLDEKQCSADIVFNYGRDFTPDYVEYRDNFGVGRKYLGH
ncbi:MAG: hypothetical protein GX801_00895 [Fibrobacter sp.]|nr:hypothetical protein [Fibrobacter sp.]